MNARHRAFTVCRILNRQSGYWSGETLVCCATNSNACKSRVFLASLISCSASARSDQEWPAAFPWKPFRLFSECTCQPQSCFFLAISTIISEEDLQLAFNCTVWKRSLIGVFDYVGHSFPCWNFSNVSIDWFPASALIVSRLVWRPLASLMSRSVVFLSEPPNAEFLERTRAS